MMGLPVLAAMVWMSAIVLPSVTSAAPLNERTENAFLWFVFVLAGAGNGFAIGLGAAALGRVGRRALGGFRQGHD